MKKTFILLLATVLFVSLAVFTSRHRQSVPESNDILGKPLFPDLAINDIAKIRIIENNVTTTVERVNDAWVAPRRFNYPAQYERIRATLMRLTEVTISEKRECTEEQKKNLQIIMPSATDTNPAGLLFELYDNGGRKIASALMGREHLRLQDREKNPFGNLPDGRFVSTDEGKTVYLVNSTMGGFRGSDIEWMDTKLVSTPMRMVTNIIVTYTNGYSISLTTSGDKTVIQDLKETEEIDEKKVDMMCYATSFLNFDDIADPALTDNDTGMDNPHRFITKSGRNEIYTVLIGNKLKDSDNYYCRVNAAFIDTLPVIPANVDAVEIQKLTNNIALGRQQVTDVKQRTEKWTYIISKKKTEPMMFTRNDIVKAREQNATNTISETK